MKFKNIVIILAVATGCIIGWNVINGDNGSNSGIEKDLKATLFRSAAK